MPAIIGRYTHAFGLSALDARLLLPLALANWFHLQWTDGRTQFSQGLYRDLEHYFENRGEWHTVLVRIPKVFGGYLIYLGGTNPNHWEIVRLRLPSRGAQTA
jgi:hypothetical protein